MKIRTFAYLILSFVLVSSVVAQGISGNCVRKYDTPTSNCSALCPIVPRIGQPWAPHVTWGPGIFQPAAGGYCIIGNKVLSLGNNLYEINPIQIYGGVFGRGVAKIDLSIPNDLSLVGGRLFFQFILSKDNFSSWGGLLISTIGEFIIQ